jgi:hypothetical protein
MAHPHDKACDQPFSFSAASLQTDLKLYHSTLETSKMLKRTHLIKVRTETVRKLKTLMAQMGKNGLDYTIGTVIRITEAHRGSLRESGWDAFPEGRRG